MTLHIIKLSVGAESVEDHVQWQARYLKMLRQKDKTARLRHTTRMTPKRGAEIVDGGSLYWVIKGYTSIRQRILALEETVEGGEPHCAIILDQACVPVVRRPQRPFQGWRYLTPDAAPADLPKGARDLPPDLQKALSDLGLL
jgi:hypothetical protein